MGWIFKPITNAITTAVLKLVWRIVIQGPLQLIHAFDKVFRYLTAGVFFDAMFGGEKFDINKLPFAFWVFLLFAGLVIMLIFVIQFFTLMYQEDSTISKRLLKAGSNTIRAGLLTIAMPAAFFLGTSLIQFCQNLIYQAFGGEDNNLARMLYYVGDTALKATDPLPPATPPFNPPDGINNWNWIAEIIGVYVTAWALCLAGLACAGKVFEMYTLFIIGPIFGASMAADDGARLKIWRDSVIAKMFVSVGTILTYSVYVTLLPMLFKYAKSSSWNFNTLETILLQVLFLIGGGVFLETMPPFFANFVGESAGKAEGKNAINVANSGRSLARAGLVGLATAIGVGKAAKEKQARKTGGFANAAANAGGSASAATNAGDGAGHQNMVGALGLVGKGIRFGSSLAGVGMATGRTIGLGGKLRAKVQRERNKEYFKGLAAKPKQALMENVNHYKRNHTEEYSRKMFRAGHITNRDRWLKRHPDKTIKDYYRQLSDRKKKKLKKYLKPDKQ